MTLRVLSRTFITSVLFVSAGHRAQFLNSDEELHNINVKNGKTREQAFNVALPPGITDVHTFEHSGVYDVSCDAHFGMLAPIIAASSPYVALADSKSRAPTLSSERSFFTSQSRATMLCWP